MAYNHDNTNNYLNLLFHVWLLMFHVRKYPNPSAGRPFAIVLC
jgi:hypothetical protein